MILSNYKLVNSFCRTSIRGGGVAIYSKMDLNLNLTSSNCNVQAVEGNFEFVCLFVSTKLHKIYYCTCI